MSFMTENAAEMAEKRGRGRPPKPKPEEAEMQHNEKPAERMIPLVLKCGWWPWDGTVYRDAMGQEQVYRTPYGPDGTVDEMARKRTKFMPGTRVQVPVHVAKPLIDTGKADLDTSL